MDRVEQIRRIEACLVGNLSYDGEGDEVCPHCKEVLRKGRVHLYHWSSLAGGLAMHMGFGGGASERLKHEVFEFATVTGDAKADAETLAPECWEVLFG